MSGDKKNIFHLSREFLVLLSNNKLFKNVPELLKAHSLRMRVADPVIYFHVPHIIFTKGFLSIRSVPLCRGIQIAALNTKG
jgi:hypothetical protein